MKEKWWQKEVVYQIYPRSFQDGNGDGIGDLSGILSRIPYLKSLGLGILWLGPIFRSPNDDNGYDVSDYNNIMDEFGTMRDFDLLLESLHAAGIRVVLDLVVNHTSDEHAWFVESQKSKDSPYRDYYFWRDGKDGREPNNWESVFSGSTWKYFPNTNQYALHLYSAKQMDLNWENEKVREEVFRLSRFWLDKGVDGFRLDTITTISKVVSFPDAPTCMPGSRYQPATQFYMDGPRIMEYLRDFRDNVFKKYDIVTIGETPGLAPQEAMRYIDARDGVMDMAIQWEHIEKDPGSGKKWDEEFWTPLYFKRIMARWQMELRGKAWNALYLGNHDQPRQVSRFGDDDVFHRESATMLATCIHLMCGTPFVYQGEEIGMTNVSFDTIDEYRCVETRNMYHDRIARGESHEALMEKIHRKSRDNARTPMQWDASEYAGFSQVKPWIGVNPNHAHINVAAQEKDPDSILNYYRKLIWLRKEYRVIVYGDFTLLMPEDERVFAYLRRLDGQTLGVFTNFGKEERPLSLDLGLNGELLISNYRDAPKTWSAEALRPFEARAYLWNT